jgi:Integrase core domain
MSAVRKQVAKELHAPARRVYPRRCFWSFRPFDLWAADLADMRALSKHNRGYAYILVIVDTFSRHAWAIPIKTKKGAEVENAFKTLFDDLNQAPSNLVTDQGTEFYNSQCQKLFQSKGVRHYSTYGSVKAAPAERMVRTLKERLYRHFSAEGTFNWVDAIEGVTDDYNNTKHSRTGHSPAAVLRDRRLWSDVGSKINESCVSDRLRGKEQQSTAKRLSIDQAVRISKQKSVFEKGYTGNWSPEIFFIHAIKRTRPMTYVLRDEFGNIIKGVFYRQELQPAMHKDVYLVEKILQRRGSKVKVRYYGLPTSYDSWIDAKNLI